MKFLSNADVREAVIAANKFIGGKPALNSMATALCLQLNGDTLTMRASNAGQHFMIKTVTVEGSDGDSVPVCVKASAFLEMLTLHPQGKVEKKDTALIVCAGRHHLSTSTYEGDFFAIPDVAGKNTDILLQDFVSGVNIAGTAAAETANPMTKHVHIVSDNHKLSFSCTDGTLLAQCVPSNGANGADIDCLLPADIVKKVASKTVAPDSVIHLVCGDHYIKCQLNESSVWLFQKPMCVPFNTSAIFSKLESARVYNSVVSAGDFKDMVSSAEFVCHQAKIGLPLKLSLCGKDAKFSIKNGESEANGSIPCQMTDDFPKEDVGVNTELFRRIDKLFSESDIITWKYYGATMPMVYCCDTPTHQMMFLLMPVRLR